MTERATDDEAAAPGVHREVDAEWDGFPADAHVFAAEIRPHRSLGPKGVSIVLGVFGVFSAILSVPFFVIGAWPVIGFLGLDVLALWLAFRFSFAQARACEQVALTYVELLVRKVTARGAAREWRFNPNWVRLESEQDEEFGMTRLSVASRGARLEVADALSPDERADFADAFGRALATAKAGPRRPSTL
ncbi:DUF2244 domain-containing protein [Chelatococcus sambhunathii]|uniref:DUF2244 domain-containing protein n=1 Tax=Chelatococcus sambhunathii TaxID=363953 RepID=A0ABU1DFV8_9HYPH|nr:DUF2244 domain-containing protein [Chelatococcus sambhunathii]MDR4307023.1 DUF2244 domain-containing protein [Chelatococcus sambhunathii]